MFKERPRKVVQVFNKRPPSDEPGKLLSAPNAALEVVQFDISKGVKDSLRVPDSAFLILKSINDPTNVTVGLSGEQDGTGDDLMIAKITGAPASKEPLSNDKFVGKKDSLPLKPPC